MIRTALLVACIFCLGVAVAVAWEDAHLHPDASMMVKPLRHFGVVKGVDSNYIILEVWGDDMRQPYGSKGAFEIWRKGELILRIASSADVKWKVLP